MRKEVKAYFDSQGVSAAKLAVQKKPKAATEATATGMTMMTSMAEALAKSNQEVASIMGDKLAEVLKRMPMAASSSNNMGSRIKAIGAGMLRPFSPYSYHPNLVFRFFTVGHSYLLTMLTLQSTVVVTLKH